LGRDPERAGRRAAGRCPRPPRWGGTTAWCPSWISAPSGAAEVAGRFDVPHHLQPVRTNCWQDLDAVYIATPQNVHCRQCPDGRRGKHILARSRWRSPSGRGGPDGGRLPARARVKFMLGFCMRNNVYNRKARELVQSGALGQMVMGRAQLTCWYPPIPGRLAAGRVDQPRRSLIDMGNHCLDLLEWTMGTSRRVVGDRLPDLMNGTGTPSRDRKDASTVLLRFANGAHGIVDNYFNLPDAAAQNALELHGTGDQSWPRHRGAGPDGNGCSASSRSGKSGYSADQVPQRASAAKQEYHLEGVGLYGQMLRTVSAAASSRTPTARHDGRRPPLRAPGDSHLHGGARASWSWRAVDECG